MCFSVQVDRDIKKLARQFDAQESCHSFGQLDSLIELQNSLSLERFESLLGLKHHFKRKKPILERKVDVNYEYQWSD